MKLVAVAVASAGLVAACGASSQQACDDYAVVYCSRNLACLTGTDLQTFQNAYGSTQDTCVMNYEALSCKATETPCASGLSYDTARQEQCTADYQNASCTDVSHPGFQPDSCSTSTLCH